MSSSTWIHVQTKPINSRGLKIVCLKLVDIDCFFILQNGIVPSHQRKYVFNFIFWYFSLIREVGLTWLALCGLFSSYFDWNNYISFFSLNYWYPTAWHRARFHRRYLPTNSIAWASLFLKIILSEETADDLYKRKPPPTTDQTSSKRQKNHSGIGLFSYWAFLIYFSVNTKLGDFEFESEDSCPGNLQDTFFTNHLIFLLYILILNCWSLARGGAPSGSARESHFRTRPSAD